MGAVRVTARFVAGRHLDGLTRSDATFLRAGTRAVTQTGRTSRWAMRPGWHRAAWRLSVSTVVIGGGVGWVIHPFATTVALTALGILGAAWGVWLTHRSVRHWRHHRAWVRPLHRALAPVLGVTSLASEWLDIPERFTDEGQRVVVKLPDHFTGTPEARRLVTTIIAGKLALEDPKIDFQMTGRPRCVVNPATPPPDRVGLVDLLPHIERVGTPTSLVVGLGRKARPITFDLQSDSPHALLSASTGGGKSVVVRTLVMQGLHDGGIALVLDVKRISQAWCRGLANVTVARDIAEIHESLLWVRTEIDRRTAVADQYTDENGELAPGVDIGPRLWVVAEEFNAMSKRLAQHWRKVKAPGQGQASPAIEALADVLYMGRALKVNVIATAQMATVNALGDSAMRECMGWRALSRHTMQSWRMLAGEVWPPPKRSKHPGRWQVVTGGEAHEMQAAFITPADARRYAMSGAVTVFPNMGEHATAQTGPAITGNAPVSATPAVANTVGLAEACKIGILSVGVTAARSARARDPEFPSGVDKRGSEILYAPDDLARWQRNRPMVKAS